jgi:hypothetical protein
MYVYVRLCFSAGDAKLSSRYFLYLGSPNDDLAKGRHCFEYEKRMLKYVGVSMTAVLLHCSTLQLRYCTMKFIVKGAILIVMRRF